MSSSVPRPRVPLIAGNWKMHTTLGEARSLAEGILSGLREDDTFRAGIRIGLFPPAVFIGEVAALVERDRPPVEEVLVGAQNIHYEPEGAFTGEISAAMVRSVGGTAVIVGHSERRHLFGETDEDAARKVARALATGLRPILCVGETIEERDAGRTMEVVRRQLTQGLSLVESAGEIETVILAYEPVWAIGTGRTATPAQAQEVHAFLRAELRDLFEARGGSPEGAERATILYGGSVKPQNAAGLLREPDIDGALVGGASLKAESFLGICRGCFAEV